VLFPKYSPCHLLYQVSYTSHRPASTLNGVYTRATGLFPEAYLTIDRTSALTRTILIHCSVRQYHPCRLLYMRPRGVLSLKECVHSQSVAHGGTSSESDSFHNPNPLVLCTPITRAPPLGHQTSTLLLGNTSRNSPIFPLSMAFRTSVPWVG
jgi:hypothetical protein